MFCTLRVGRDSDMCHFIYLRLAKREPCECFCSLATSMEGPMAKFIICNCEGGPLCVYLVIRMLEGSLVYIHVRFHDQNAALLICS